MRSDGEMSDPSAQRLVLPEALDEEMVQANKRSIEFSERRRSDQVHQNSPPLLSGSVFFSEAIRRRIEHVAPTAEAPEASGARNTQANRTDPHAREILPQPLEVLPGNGAGASPPLGEDTQDPSPVDYSLEIEADFPAAMVIELQKTRL
jgi:hypothetical protein